MKKEKMLTKEEVEAKDYKEVSLVFKKIFENLNQMGSDAVVKAALEHVLSIEHPTLRQSFFRTVILTVIKKFAEDYKNGHYDLRNEESCKIAAKCYEITKDAAIPFI